MTRDEQMYVDATEITTNAKKPAMASHGAFIERISQPLIFSVVSFLC